MDTINLQAYLQRIGYTEPADTSLSTLQGLVTGHLAHIPFESMAVLLGDDISLQAEHVDHKLLQAGRGGYCFEHANLTQRALTALGFETRAYLARVRLSQGFNGPAPPATHNCLQVWTDQGVYLVDTGFGGGLPDAPLLWQTGTTQTTRFGHFRLSPTRDGLLLSSWYQEAWAPLYEILDFPWADIDFTVANFYVQRSTKPPFARHLIASVVDDKFRHNLFDNRYTCHERGGPTYTDWLDSQQLADTLQQQFGLPVTARWQPILARLASSQEPS